MQRTATPKSGSKSDTVPRQTASVRALISHPTMRTTRSKIDNWPWSPSTITDNLLITNLLYTLPRSQQKIKITTLLKTLLKKLQDSNLTTFKEKKNYALIYLREGIEWSSDAPDTFTLHVILGNDCLAQGCTRARLIAKLIISEDNGINWELKINDALYESKGALSEEDLEAYYQNYMKESDWKNKWIAKLIIPIVKTVTNTTPTVKPVNKTTPTVKTVKKTMKFLSYHDNIVIQPYHRGGKKKVAKK